MIFLFRFPPFPFKEGHTDECDEEGTSVSKVFFHYPPIVKDRHLSKQRASIMAYSTESQQHLYKLRVRDWEKEGSERKKERKILYGSSRCLSLVCFLNQTNNDH